MAISVEPYKENFWRKKKSCLHTFRKGLPWKTEEERGKKEPLIIATTLAGAGLKWG
jgi:hypothetical protein